VKEEEFFQRLKILYGRVSALRKNTSTAPWQREVWLPFALEELDTAFEELQVAEEELRAQNEQLVATRQTIEAERQRYQDLFEFAPDGYLVTDAQGKIQEANYAAAKLLNVKPQFLVGKPLINFVCESARWNFRSRLNQLCQSTSASAQEWEVRLSPRRPIGNDLENIFFDASITVSATRDQAGQGLALRWLLRDVTARNQVEERLRLLESVAVNMTEAVVITEAESIDEPGPRILYVNEAFTRLTGYSQQEAVGQTPRFMQGPQTDRAALDTIRMALEKFEPVVVELINYHKDGSTYWVEISLVPVADETGYYTHWVAVERDVTERKRAAADQIQLIQEQAARIEAEAASRAKDEFLAVVSHELRTPLNAILGWTQLLSTRKLDDAKITQALETISRNAKVQAQLIEDLLDLSRITSGNLRLNIRTCKLAPLIEAVIDTVRPAVEAKAIRLESALDPSSKTVLADPNRLQQVVWNLLSNAVKFTPPGGRVTIRLSTVNKEWSELEESKFSGLIYELEHSAQHAELNTQSYAQIQVSDTGIGITPDFLPYVFDRFRQSDSTSTRSHTGLGLGLAITRQLVELHSGTVHGASQGEGQGAIFTVQLPLAGVATALGDTPPMSRATSRGVRADGSPALAGRRVLVVEDETDALEYITTVLEQCGAEVTAVVSASEALEVLQGVKPDVLVSDISMPHEDGYALIRQVRALKPEQGGRIPAAALTAYAREEDRVCALAAGFQMHIPKPVEPAELVAAVVNLARPAPEN